MPYNENLEMRISETIAEWKNISKKKMFGGVCYLCNGKMMGGIYKDFLIIRLGTDDQEKILKQRFVKAFDITGKPMKGWVMIEPEGYGKRKLLDWLEKAHAFVATLPKK